MSKIIPLALLSASFTLIPACTVEPARAWVIPNLELRDTALEPSTGIDDAGELVATQAQEKRDQDRTKEGREERAARRQREREERDARLQDPDWPAGAAPRRSRDAWRTTYERQWGQAPAHRGGYLRFSYGDGDFDLKDGRGVVDNGARAFRLRGGWADRDGTGAGADLKYFEGRRNVYSGSDNTGVDQPELFVFFTSRVGDGPFTVPYRIGPYYNILLTERNTTGDYTTNNNIGLRFEAEPTLDLYRDEDVRLSLFTRLSAGAHATWIDDEVTRENYHSKGTTLAVEPGVRLLIGDVEFGASYHLQETSVRRSSYERGQTLGRQETEFRGFEFSFGFRF